MITTATQESKLKHENSYRKVQNVVIDCKTIRARQDEILAVKQVIQSRVVEHLLFEKEIRRRSAGKAL